MHDNDFLRDLTDRAERTIPDLTVHTDQVIPRAHRRRRLIRAGQTAGVLAVLAVIAGGATWAWQDRPAPPALPSPTVSPSPHDSPAPSPEPTPSDSPEPPQPPAQTEAPPAPEVTAELPYWHTRIENNVPSLVDAYGAYSETWRAIGRTGLSMTEGNPETALALDPAVETLFPADRDPIELPTDAGRLPTDVAELRAVLQSTPDVYASPEHAAVSRAWDLLEWGGIIPGEVRRTAVQVIFTSELTEVSEGHDDTGRPGLVVVFHHDDIAQFNLIIDPDQALLLQVDGLEGIWSGLYYWEAVAGPPFDPGPVAPATTSP